MIVIEKVKCGKKLGGEGVNINDQQSKALLLPSTGVSDVSK